LGAYHILNLPAETKLFSDFTLASSWRLCYTGGRRILPAKAGSVNLLNRAFSGKKKINKGDSQEKKTVFGPY
jgi:hypothetical protein